MKTRVSAFLFVLMTPAFFAAGVYGDIAGRPPVPAVVYDLFGRDILSTMLESSRVESFTVIPGAQGELPGGFAEGVAGENLTPDQRREVLELLTDPGSFVFGMVKKCLFLPDAGLRFIAGDREAVLLFSSSCMTFSAYQGEHYAHEDYDPISDRLNNLFPALLGTW